MSSEQKLSNPKDIIGASKLPLHLWPETATIYGALGLMDGALKYGRGNFRAVGVRASIYYDAARRHLNAWFEGQDTDQDSGLPHLAHALACLAILVDAVEANKLNDDRQYPGGYHATVKKMTPHVERLKALRTDAMPDKHYNIETPARDGVMKLFGSCIGVPYTYEPGKGFQSDLLKEASDSLKHVFVGTPQHIEPDDLPWEDAEGDPNYWGV